MGQCEGSDKSPTTTATEPTGTEETDEVGLVISQIHTHTRTAVYTGCPPGFLYNIYVQALCLPGSFSPHCEPAWRLCEVVFFPLSPNTHH